MSISKNPLLVTYAVLAPDPRHSVSDTIKFVVKEEPKVDQAQGSLAIREEPTPCLITGVSEQTESVDYPLIAYNSFVPDNSEIVLTSLAEHIKKS